MATTFFGGAFFGGEFFGSLVPPEPELPPPILAGAALRSLRRHPVEDEVKTAHATITISGGGEIFVSGHKSVEFPPDDEVMQFIGMI